MGTEISIMVRSNQDPNKDIEAGFAIFRSYEQEFSRFHPDSVLSLLNMKKAAVPSPRFLKIMNLCDRIYLETGGIFNPLINLCHIGYTSSFETSEFVPTDEVLDTDWKRVSISPENITIWKNQYLDLGGIVKGYSVDDVRDYLLGRWYTDFIVNAGGDIYLAGIDNDGPWKVGIDNPKDPSEILATLEIRDGSISTSGTYKRKWQVGWVQHHHIIDPRDDSNPSEIISISIIGQHTWMTDVYATVGLIKGVDEAIPWLESRWLAGVIVSESWKIYTTKRLDSYSPAFFI